MTSKAWCAALGLCLSVSAGVVVAQTTESYQDLVARARNGDLTVDFVRLIVLSSERQPSERAIPDATRQALMAAIEARDNRRAAQVAEIFLTYEFTNLDFHLGLADIYKGLAEGEKEAQHRDWVDRIVRAQISTGDGLSPDTCYCVQSVDDEYHIVESLGYKVTMQTLTVSGGRQYDLLTGTDANGKPIAAYFSVSEPFARCVASRQKKS